MNKKQKIIVGITIALIVLSVIFPHYVTISSKRICGYGFISKGKIHIYNTDEGKIFERCKINTTRLLLQILIIAIIGAYLYFERK